MGCVGQPSKKLNYDLTTNTNHYKVNSNFMNDLFFEPREPRDFPNMDDGGSDGNGNNWPEADDDYSEEDIDEQLNEDEE